MVQVRVRVRVRVDDDAPPLWQQRLALRERGGLLLVRLRRQPQLEQAGGDVVAEGERGAWLGLGLGLGLRLGLGFGFGLET